MTNDKMEMRCTMRASSLSTAFFRWPIIARIIIIITGLIVLFGSLIHFVEPKGFPTIFDGIWWAIVTTSTVGYGDFSPSTIIGRVVAIALILLGTGFVTTYFILLSTSAVSAQNAFLDGKLKYSGNGHIILIGWNERVRETIMQLSFLKPSMDLVLIDETVETNPLPANAVHLIKDDPTFDETLIKANIKDAHIVIITSDQKKDEAAADMGTILTLLAVKGVNPRVYCVAEILTLQQVNNAKRAGADEIIQTNLFTSYMMTNCILSHGLSNAALALFNHLKGNTLKYIAASDDLFGKNFATCSKILLMENQQLLIGVKRDGNTMINPPIDLRIQFQDELLVIKE